MKVPNREEVDDFFNTKRQLELYAQRYRIKVECAEIQAEREVRLIAEHNYDDCDAEGCWICLERGRERAEDIKDAERKDGREG